MSGNFGMEFPRRDVAGDPGGVRCMSGPRPGQFSGWAFRVMSSWGWQKKGENQEDIIKKILARTYIQELIIGDYRRRF